MSGIFIIVALILGVVLAAGIGVYLKSSSTRTGKVKPEAPPTEAELKRADPESDPSKGV